MKEYYSKLIFTEEQISEAEDERASVNKIVKKIADYRKEIVSEFKKPIENFEITAKETEKILKETSEFIDVQVKNYEKKVKDKKKTEIEIIFNKLIEEKGISNLLNLEMLFDERFLNKGYKIEDVEKDLLEKVNKIVNDIQAIKDLNSEYEVSLTNNYLNNFDLSKVIAENKRLLEKQEEIRQERVTEMLTKKVQTEEIDPVKEYVLKIKAPLSKQKELRRFLELNKMEFEKIEG